MSFDFAYCMQAGVVRFAMCFTILPYLPAWSGVQPVVVQSAADFGGVERMVVDEMLTERHCQALIRLASVSQTKGS